MLGTHDLQSSAGITGRGSYCLNAEQRLQRPSAEPNHLSGWNFWAWGTFPKNFRSATKRWLLNIDRQRSASNPGSGLDQGSTATNLSQVIYKDVGVSRTKQFEWHLIGFRHQFTTNRSGRARFFISTRWPVRYAHEQSNGPECSGMVGNGQRKRDSEDY